jgi:hypothetical protein
MACQLSVVSSKWFINIHVQAYQMARPNDASICATKALVIREEVGTAVNESYVLLLDRT